MFHSVKDSGALVKKNASGELVAYRAPRFDEPPIVKDIAESSKMIMGGPIDSPEKVNALAL